MKPDQIKIGEGIFLSLGEEWENLHNINNKKYLPKNKWDKYLCWSKDRAKLVRILYAEVIDGGFPSGKINTAIIRRNDRDVLCLYFKDASRLESLQEKYPEMSFIWKDYTSKEIKQKEENLPETNEMMDGNIK